MPGLTVHLQLLNTYLLVYLTTSKKLGEERTISKGTIGKNTVTMVWKTNMNTSDQRQNNTAASANNRDINYIFEGVAGTSIQEQCSQHNHLLLTHE